MARLDSLNILTTGEGREKLAESYGKVIENIQKSTISGLLKNTDLSGTPETGTVEAKRFVNSTAAAYGTARAGGKGEALKAVPVVIAIDTDKEIINEVEEKDTALYGVDGLIAKKTAMNEKAMKRELERAFFTVAGNQGTTATLEATAINEKVEELIQLVENTKNDYVDGVDRDMISVVLDTKTYGALRNYLDSTAVANVDTAVGEMGMFHGVRVFSSVYTGKSMIAMVDGAVAQPVLTTLDEAGKIPMSNAYHFGLFYSYGTKAVMPDLIQVVA
jgi:hypothetical protein